MCEKRTTIECCNKKCEIKIPTDLTFESGSLLPEETVDFFRIIDKNVNRKEDSNSNLVPTISSREILIDGSTHQINFSSVNAHQSRFGWPDGLPLNKRLGLLSERHYGDSDDFAPGWWFIGRRKDVSDYEWKTWLQFLWSVSPWVFVHLVGAELMRCLHHQLLQSWYLFISLLFLVYYVGFVATVFLLAQPCIFYVILRLRSCTLVWAASAVVLAVLNTEQTSEWLSLPEEKQYLVFVCFAWTHLRCLSFCFDQLLATETSFMSAISYVFYLPTLFLGPLILHEQFQSGIAMVYKRWTFDRGLELLASLARFIGWLFFTELALHYVYCNALQYHTEAVAGLSLWALCGLGYCMGQFFMNKYVVAYGLPSCIARAEQFTPPKHPKCIARIHLYSDMWKHFDPGLYSFLVKYIYVPLLGMKVMTMQRLVASSACFFFIYLWHRTYSCILVWSLLNFLGVSVEAMCKNISRTEFYSSIEKMISERAVRRCHAALASPLFAMSCISNFYFFGGMEIGNIFFQRLFQVSLANCVVLCFCYCCCQVSIEVKNWETRCRMQTSSTCAATFTVDSKTSHD